jgi:hypothetical protein
MNYLGNDPTGTYRGKFSHPPRHPRQRKHKSKRHWHRAFRGRRAKPDFCFAIAYENDRKAPGKRLHSSQVAHQPDHQAWLIAQASKNFWDHAKPKTQSQFQ